MTLKHTAATPTRSPVDGADAGDAVVVTHSLGQEPVPDLPGKHGGILAFVIGDLVDHFGSSNLWFGSPDYPGADAARFVVSFNENTEDTRGLKGKFPGSLVYLSPCYISFPI